MILEKKSQMSGKPVIIVLQFIEGIGRIILHILCVQFLGFFESYSLLLRVITLTLRKKMKGMKKPKKNQNDI